MRVALDGTFLGAARGGDETFLRGLLRGLALRRDPEDEFPVLLSPGAVVDELEDSPSFPLTRLPTRPGPWHFFGRLPGALRRIGTELAVTVTHAPLFGSVPNAVVVGDLSFVHRPQDYPRATAMRLNTLVPMHVRRAAAVLVPSEFTRSDLISTLGVDPARVHVVPNLIPPAVGLPAAARDEADTWLAANGVQAPYLLYLGNLHPRKNVPLLIRSFLAAQSQAPALRDHQLVIAGGAWWDSSAEREAAEGHDQVRFLGRVTDEVRTRLLARAEALAYVSLFEGFGLPPLEAMAYGTPVIASDVTSLPEVCGAAAVLVDPHDPEAIVDGLRRVLTDESLRGNLRAAGPGQAAGFDAARVGDAALAAFRSALGRSGLAPAPVRSAR